MNMATVNFTKANFKQEVLQSEQPVLLDFWAPWCGPCKRVSPIVEEIAAEVSGAVKVGKINIDEHPELASQFRIMSIPTLMVVKDGKPVSTSVGVKSKQEILNMLSK